MAITIRDHDRRKQAVLVSSSGENVVQQRSKETKQKYSYRSAAIFMPNWPLNRSGAAHTKMRHQQAVEPR